jgi:pimeloyl-ACP methyl ester carboxylesterase
MHADEGLLPLPNGIRLHYRRLGQGPDTILLPNGDYLLDDFRGLARERRVIVYSPRNRGRSDSVTDPALLREGIRNDAEDLEHVRRHFGLDRFLLIAHSYASLFAMLHTLAHPGAASRVVLVGPMPPFPNKKYEGELHYDDGVLGSVFARIQKLPAATANDTGERCRQVWKILSELYVTDARNAARADWGRCDQPNERNFMAYLMQYITPSIQQTTLTPAHLGTIAIPVLVVHGRKDRSAAYGAGRDWAMHLGQARLLTVPEGGHAPWIEDPGVLEAIATFLGGEWPAAAEQVRIS